MYPHTLWHDAWLCLSILFSQSFTYMNIHRVVLLLVCVGSPAGCLEPNTEKTERRGWNEGAFARVWLTGCRRKTALLFCRFCSVMHFISPLSLFSLLSCFPLSLRHEPTWTQTSSDPCSGLEGIEHTYTHKHCKCTDSNHRLPACRVNAVFWKSWCVM